MSKNPHCTTSDERHDSIPSKPIEYLGTGSVKPEIKPLPTKGIKY